VGGGGCTASEAVAAVFAPGGPDPDGPGKWQTTLMEPTKIAAREKFDVVVNGDFFKARGVNDGEGANSAYRARLWALAVDDEPDSPGGRLRESRAPSEAPSLRRAVKTAVTRP